MMGLLVALQPSRGGRATQLYAADPISWNAAGTGGAVAALRHHSTTITRHAAGVPNPAPKVMHPCTAFGVTVRRLALALPVFCEWMRVLPASRQCKPCCHITATRVQWPPASQSSLSIALSISITKPDRLVAKTSRYSMARVQAT